MPFPEIPSKRKPRWSSESDPRDPGLKVPIDTSTGIKTPQTNIPFLSTDEDAIPLQIHRRFHTRTNGNPGKQGKREPSEHHFSDSSIVFPNQEIGGGAAIRTENTSRGFIIDSDTWEFGTLFTSGPAEMPELPTIRSLALVIEML